MKTPISFRLRKDLDADLIKAVEKLDKRALKALCRDGLRLMLGIRTTRTIEFQERPLSLPQFPVRPDDPAMSIDPGQGAAPVNKPTIYVPGRQNKPR
ncbi:hypothetical protein ACHHV8_36750 [Paenibacillus sp. TAB 01]|uniref:hypothetical protein n=1 Tax=Paenibacillus sp. TAB 01 TaxID=3368988 RepID=UPI003752EAB8